jgi:hypothetical protein
VNGINAAPLQPKEARRIDCRQRCAEQMADSDWDDDFISKQVIRAP